MKEKAQNEKIVITRKLTFNKKDECCLLFEVAKFCFQILIYSIFF